MGRPSGQVKKAGAVNKKGTGTRIDRADQQITIQIRDRQPRLRERMATVELNQISGGGPAAGPTAGYTLCEFLPCARPQLAQSATATRRQDTTCASVVRITRAVR